MYIFSRGFVFKICVRCTRIITRFYVFFRGCRGAVYIKTPRKWVKRVCRKRPTFSYTYGNICIYIICMNVYIYKYKRRTLLRKWVRNASVTMRYLRVYCVYTSTIIVILQDGIRIKRVFERAFCYKRNVVFEQHLFDHIIINYMRHIIRQQ